MANRKEIYMMPKVIGLSVKEAVYILSLIKVQPCIVGQGIIIEQIPEAGKAIKLGGDCFLKTTHTPGGVTLLMPKVIGLTERESRNRLALLKIEASIKGQGRVVHQIPDYGESINEGGFCFLECKSNIAFREHDKILDKGLR